MRRAGRGRRNRPRARGSGAARIAYDVVITDLRMENTTASTSCAAHLAEVIVMTAYEDAVRPARSTTSSHSPGLARARRPGSQGRCSAAGNYHLENIVGPLTWVVKVAPTDAAVPITGEGGAEQELVAHAVHVGNSARQPRSATGGSEAGPGRSRPCDRARRLFEEAAGRSCRRDARLPGQPARRVRRPNRYQGRHPGGRDLDGGRRAALAGRAPAQRGHRPPRRARVSSTPGGAAGGWYARIETA